MRFFPSILLTFIFCLSYSLYLAYLILCNNIIKLQLTPMGRKNGYYGYLAGTATAAVLQPLDNIKMALIVPPSNLKLSNNFLKNIYLAFRYIKIEQGWTSFYKGLVVNTVKTGMSSAVYFYLLRSIQKLVPQNSVAGNFTASALARIASAVVANPLGVIQARYEISGVQKWSGSIAKNLHRVYSIQGLQGFFKGCAASCWKQACFAGLYYTLYEEGKNLGLSSIVAGMASGIISTFATHPFEIIRTNIQVHINFHENEINHKEESIFKQLSSLYRQGKLFDGVTPRLVKKPLANTLAFCIFEYMERLQLKKIDS